MKKILKSALLLVMGMALLTSCEDDNDSNPVLVAPTEFHLNTPALANTNIDLAHSSALELTCSQPNYGFPASTQYKVQVSLDKNMADAVELDETTTSAKVSVDPSVLASTLTNLALVAGKTEADFPMDIPVYLRLRANMLTETGDIVEGTEILSNTVCLSNVHLLYSLPPVSVPEHLYIVGSFCGWDWGNCFEFVPVYDHPETYWRMVWIDGAGVKINTDKAWDGNEKGYDGITVEGDLASEIIRTDDGNIASSKPGWYLVVVNATVEGRNVKFHVQFNKPEVWLMGPVVGNSSWNELEEGWSFSVPATADGDFVSPAFAGAVEGGDKDGVRAYVKLPGNDWWHSEFMIYDGVIAYRGAGGDQSPRVAGAVGQKLYLNFATGTGEIK